MNQSIDIKANHLSIIPMNTSLQNKTKQSIKIKNGKTIHNEIQKSSLCPLSVILKCGLPRRF
jgi:hypothetical protein